MKLETWQRDRKRRKKKSDRQDREKVLVCMRFFHCLFLYC